VEALWSFLLLALGAALLLGGCELFTEKSREAAGALRITPFALALLFAGAEPEELLTAAIASGRGAAGIAVGDLVGTNVTIIALALGLGTLLTPIPSGSVSLRHGLFAIGMALPAATLLLAGSVERPHGLILVALYGLYALYVVMRERVTVDEEASTRHDRAALPLMLLGLAMMAFGGSFTVDSARAIVAITGISETAIGLTLVSLATSAEMVALSIIPVIKGRPELTIGGIIGSYIYNATLGLGVAALVAPLRVDRVGLVFPVALMLGLLALLIALLRGQTIGRKAGMLLLAIYFIYLAYNFLYRQPTGS